jgi:hypothetical protein
MKRFGIALARVLRIVAAVGGYYYSAWHVAQDAAVAIAAGDEQATAAGSPWSLGSALPHDRLVVRTHPGWFVLSGSLAFPFTVTDRVTNRSVDLGVDVEFTTGGWRVVGAGDLGG